MTKEEFAAIRKLIDNQAKRLRLEAKYGSGDGKRIEAAIDGLMLLLNAVAGSVAPEAAATVAAAGGRS